MSFPEMFAAVINWVNDTVWSAPFLIFVIVIGVYSVSYTHLDVYKRQAHGGCAIRKKGLTTLL